MERDRYANNQDYRDGYDAGLKDATAVEINDVSILKTFIDASFEHVNNSITERKQGRE